VVPQPDRDRDLPAVAPQRDRDRDLIRSLFPDEIGPSHNCRGDLIEGLVANSSNSLVTLGNDDWLISADGSAGNFKFTDVPDGTYSLYAEGPGVTFGPEHIITVSSQGSVFDFV
jgi:hypothetical protein